MIREARLSSPRPRVMENRGAPPVPQRLAKAVTMYVAGITRPMPVKASRPMESMWPIKARSTTLYKTTVSWATVRGMARERIFLAMLPWEKSFFCCCTMLHLHLLVFLICVYCKMFRNKLQEVCQKSGKGPCGVPVLFVGDALFALLQFLFYIDYDGTHFDIQRTADLVKRLQGGLALSTLDHC